MTKKEIVERITPRAGISEETAALAFDAFLDAITKGLTEGGGRVILADFGTFEKVRRTDRRGKELEPPSYTVRFKPGKNLRQAL